MTNQSQDITEKLWQWQSVDKFFVILLCNIPEEEEEEEEYNFFN